MGNKSSLMLQDEQIRQLNEETGFSAQQIEKLYSRFAHLDRSNCGSLSKDDLMSIPELAVNPLCGRLIEMFFADSDKEDERINFRQFMRVLAAFRSHPNSYNNNCLVLETNNNSTNDNNNNDINTTKQHAQNKLSRIYNNKRRISTTLQHNNPDDSKQSRSNEKLAKNSIVDALNEGLRNKLLFVFKIYDNDSDGRISFSDLRKILKMMVGNYIEDVQLDKIATRAFLEVDQDSDGFIEFGEFCKVFAGKDLDDKIRVKFFN